MPRKLLSAAAVAFVTALAGLGVPAVASATTPAPASGTFQITGAGDGHGIGMSQYGAMGYAEHGWSYEGILAHYYQGTGLSKAPNSTVTVLLNQGAAVFRGASAADGQALDPSTSYGVVVSGAKLDLVSGGRDVGSFSVPLRVTGSDLDLVGHGQYAGSFSFYPDGSSGVSTVNAVDLEDYVKGVIAEEMPASWPEAALETQAVAARSYVLASVPVSSEFDVYDNTESQMYGGISGETAATNLAEADTSGQVVEAAGKVVPTFFSASSGGHTESIQNVWLGDTPEPYLTGVSDPYDDAADDPYYRWTSTLSLASAASRLAGLYRGSFIGVRVLREGLSPRIVSAQVIGSKGSSTASGETLEEDLGTMSTWMSFTTLTAHGSSGSGRPGGSGSSSNPPRVGGSGGSSNPPRVGGSGGSGLGDLAREPDRSVSGTVFPAVHGQAVEIEQRVGEGRWSPVGVTRVDADGAYALAVLAAGTYRAVCDGAAAPAVSLS